MVDDHLAFEEPAEVQRLLALDDPALHRTPAHLVVQLHGKQSGGALLIGGGVQPQPEVDDVLLLAGWRLLVAVEQDVAVPAEELAVQLGSLLDTLEVLDSPDLQTLLRRNYVVLAKSIMLILFEYLF